MCNGNVGHAKSSTININNIIGRNNGNGNTRDDGGSISNGSNCNGILILILIVDIISPPLSS